MRTARDFTEIIREKGKTTEGKESGHFLSRKNPLEVPKNDAVEKREEIKPVFCFILKIVEQKKEKTDLNKNNL